MKLLVLGGTEFVGRAFVDEAVALGWEVTTFNRGTHEPRAGVRALRGDRTAPGGLAALERGEWDVVVDTWSWARAAVGAAASLLADRAGHYVYVSSRSVYERPVPFGADESAPVVAVAADDGDGDYAKDKAGAELGAVAAFGDRALLARAGLILGPYENIGRLPWWL
ncbi:reductase, partial [Nonomuraea angiospora]